MTDIIDGLKTRLAHRLQLNDDIRNLKLDIESLGYSVDQSFVEGLHDVLNEKNQKDRIKSGYLVLSEYSCFNCLVREGNLSVDLSCDDTKNICRYLNNNGENFFNEYNNVVGLEDKSCFYYIPEGYTVLRGSGPKLCVTARWRDKYGNALDYLLDSDSIFHGERYVIGQLNTLVQEQMINGWPKILLELLNIIESQINLDEVDCSSSNSSISSFSVALLKIIHTKVQEFIRSIINVEFGRFGIALDLDGMSALHFYALLNSWKLLSKGQRNRSMKEIQSMQMDENNWREYFISNVCSQPIDASKAVAKNLVKTAIDEFLKALKVDAGKEIGEQLTKYRDQFSSKKIQDELDSNLLFSKRSEDKLVIEYITNQTQYVTEEFEMRFKDKFNQIKSQALFETQQIFFKEMTKFQRTIVDLKRYIETKGMEDMTSKVMFHGGDTNVFDVNADEANVTAMKFFIDYCKGKANVKPFDRFSDLKVQDRTSIVQYCDTDSKFGVPLLFYFCDEASDVIAKYITESSDSSNWSLVDMKLDSLYNDFKNSSIGCPETCPTCGRKCDQDINSMNHRHSCELGHQIRGMSGVRLESGTASTETCEEIRNDRKVYLETENIWCTWYDLKQKNRDWDYVCLTDDDKRLDRIVKIRHCWDTYGKALCNHHATRGIPIKFVPYSKANSAGGTCHYVVVLDESGSMAGVKFQDAKNGAVTFGNDLFSKDSQSRLSVVFFSSDARVLFKEGDKNSLPQLQSASYRSGGTNFDAALGEAANVIDGCSQSAYTRHIILFYTDGQACYPSSALNKIQNIRSRKNIDIDMYAICEESNPTVLKQICENLHPEDHASHLRSNITPDQLGLVMSEIIAT